MAQSEYGSTELSLLTGSAGTSHLVEQQAIEITLTTGTVVRYAEDTATISGQAFTNYLEYVGQLKQSSGASVDRAEIRLFNADGALTSAFTSVDVLENAEAVVFRVYTDPVSGSVYKRVRFSGIIVDPVIDDETIQFVVISDVFANNSVAGDTWVDRKCTKRYKDATPGECGYSGSLESCDYTYDGANGCRIHFSEEDAKKNYGGDSLQIDEQTLRDLTGSTGTPTQGGVGIGGGDQGDQWRLPDDGYVNYGGGYGL